MQKNDIFDKYSHYYDLLYKDKDYNSEVEYVHSLISKYSFGAKTLIDFGCGTGRHDIIFAQKGYDITGVDLSEKMISIAKKSRIKNVNFLQGDIRYIRLNKLFDVAVSLFHVISYQKTNNDIKAAFETAKAHVAKDGLFIFDCWYGPAVLTDKPSIRVKRLENDVIKLSRKSKPEMHPNENYVDVIFDVDIMDKKTRIHNTIKEIHTMRYLFFPEIEMFATNAGFNILHFEEWMSGKTPHLNSWNVVFICKHI